MNIDDYINNLQSDLDSQLSQFGLNGGQQNAANEGEKKFCPECGTQVEVDANFCPSCGYNFNAETVAPDDSTLGTQDNSNEQEGIVWTDTQVLAKKYGISRNAVLDVIEGFINANDDLDLCWHLLDMADHQHELGEATWMDYSEVLQNYIKNEGIAPGPHLSLFIIGGNDVIPQPAEDNPCGSVTDYDSYV